MNTAKINALVRFFAMAAEKEKLPANSDDPDTILKNLSKLDTFKARVEYAEKNLKHMSSGSSRVIYELNKDTVLKLAKNERGIAQNKVEANPKMKSKYIVETLKADRNGLWKTSPMCEKITEKEFEKMVGFNFKDFGEVLSYEMNKDVDDGKKPKIKDYDKIAKSEIVKELKRLGKEFDLLSGDMIRISSWGRKGNQIKILDTGLTEDIFNEFYDKETGKPKSSKST